MDNIILENMYFEHNISSLTDKYIIECYEDSYMCESVLDSIKTFFSNLKEKIKDIFNKIIAKITGKSKENTNKLNEIEDKIKDNPKLGLVKVQIADPNKVEAEIDKQKKEYLNNKNKEKGKFKVDKKKVATTATVTVTLGAAVVLLKKGIIKLPDEVQKIQKNVTSTIDKNKEQLDREYNMLRNNYRLFGYDHPEQHSDKEIEDALKREQKVFGTKGEHKMEEIEAEEKRLKEIERESSEVVQAAQEATVMRYELLLEECNRLLSEALNATYKAERIKKDDLEGLYDTDSVEKFDKIASAARDKIEQNKSKIDSIEDNSYSMREDRRRNMAEIRRKAVDDRAKIIDAYNRDLDELEKKYPSPDGKSAPRLSNMRPSKIKLSMPEDIPNNG
jgi:hypothetical protein